MLHFKSIARPPALLPLVVLASIACSSGAEKSPEDNGVSGDGGTSSTPDGSGGEDTGVEGSSGGSSASSGGGDPGTNPDPDAPCDPVGGNAEGLELVASPFGGIRTLYGKGDYLYYPDEEYLVRVDVSPAAEAEAEAPKVDFVEQTNENVYRLFASDTHLYFIQDSQRNLFRVPLASPSDTPELLGTGIDDDAILEDDGGFYYKAEGVKFLSWSASSTVDAQPVVDTSTQLHSLHGEQLYYSYAGTTYRVPVAGGEPEQLLDLRYVTDYQVVDGVGYRMTDSNIYAHAEGQENIRLTARSDDFGTPVLETMVIHGDTIYFQDVEGNVGWVRTDRSGCGIDPLCWR